MGRITKLNTTYRPVESRNNSSVDQVWRIDTGVSSGVDRGPREVLEVPSNCSP